MTLPPLVDPTELEHYRDDDVVLVDLSRRENRARYPLAGSIALDYRHLVVDRPPAAGLLPKLDDLAELLGNLGIDRDTPVIAYDDEGGGKAARLLWTLDCLGHERHALLDGGLAAAVPAGLPVGGEAPQRPARTFMPTVRDDCSANADWIMGRLGAADFQAVDARSAEEFDGRRRFAARAGHIPGAIHCDWLELMDRDRDLRLLAKPQLDALLKRKGIDPERETVTYCQTHHRSSLLYYALRVAGLRRVRGYPGSWSDWGNRQDTPIEP